MHKILKYYYLVADLWTISVSCPASYTPSSYLLFEFLTTSFLTFYSLMSIAP